MAIDTPSFTKAALYVNTPPKLFVLEQSSQEEKEKIDWKAGLGVSKMWLFFPVFLQKNTSKEYHEGSFVSMEPLMIHYRVERHTPATALKSYVPTNSIGSTSFEGYTEVKRSETTHKSKIRPCTGTVQDRFSDI